MTETLILGDCIQEMSKMQDNSYEVVVTSPPYNIGIEYDNHIDDVSDYNDWTINWLSEAIRVSKRGVLLNIDSKPSGQTELFVTLGKIASHFKIQNTIIWVKSIHVKGETTGHVKPVQGRKYLNHAHEIILHVTDKHLDVDRLGVGVPYTYKSNIERWSQESDLRCGGTTWFVPYKTKNTRDKHPAAFPIELAKKMILYAGGDGPVLDPFCGSGTTLMAARELCRDSVGIDISDSYIELSRNRIKE